LTTTNLKCTDFRPITGLHDEMSATTHHGHVSNIYYAYS